MVCSRKSSPIASPVIGELLRERTLICVLLFLREMLTLRLADEVHFARMAFHRPHRDGLFGRVHRRLDLRQGRFRTHAVGAMCELQWGGRMTSKTESMAARRVRERLCTPVPPVGDRCAQRRLKIERILGACGRADQCARSGDDDTQKYFFHTCMWRKNRKIPAIHCIARLQFVLAASVEVRGNGSCKKRIHATRLKM